jgi:hypothetical protein
MAFTKLFRDKYVTTQRQSKGTLKKCKTLTQIIVIIGLDFVIFQLSMSGTKHFKAREVPVLKSLVLGYHAWL